ARQGVHAAGLEELPAMCAGVVDDRLPERKVRDRTVASGVEGQTHHHAPGVRTWRRVARRGVDRRRVEGGAVVASVVRQRRGLEVQDRAAGRAGSSEPCERRQREKNGSAGPHTLIASTENDAAATG